MVVFTNASVIQLKCFINYLQEKGISFREFDLALAANA